MRVRFTLNTPGWIGRTAVSAAGLFYALPARAAGSSMPWEAPLQSILESIEGPVAKIVAVIVIIVTGLSLAFGETSGGFRRLIQIVFGLSIAFAASSFFLSFFSFGGGALIATTTASGLAA
ncbi:conjugal transfer protein TrbC [Caulobacter sp. D4A]|nr:conjugal transfer protein TrbC [Caulobacter sp. D5]PXA95764.1 conjugal transfer protein TrbC [Caulobacter sp. D4A]